MTCIILRRLGMNPRACRDVAKHMSTPWECRIKFARSRLSRALWLQPPRGGSVIKRLVLDCRCHFQLTRCQFEADGTNFIGLQPQRLERGLPVSDGAGGKGTAC
jgi:hypothetical protein